MDEAEASPDGTVVAVAAVEIEALEGRGRSSLVRPRPVSATRDASRRPCVIVTVPGGGVQRIAFSTRLETTWSTRSLSAQRAAVASVLSDERKASVARRALRSGARRPAPATARSTVSRRTVKALLRMRAESSRSPTSRSSRLDSAPMTSAPSSGFDGAVADALGVATDGGQRRLELMTDREQERLLGLLRLRQLGVHVVERDGELTQLARTLRRHGHAGFTFGEPPARLGEPAHGTHDAPREDPGAQQPKRDDDRHAERCHGREAADRGLVERYVEGVRRRDVLGGVVAHVLTARRARR